MKDAFSVFSLNLLSKLAELPPVEPQNWPVAKHVVQ
jgi:hypothetical protein